MLVCLDVLTCSLEVGNKLVGILEHTLVTNDLECPQGTITVLLVHEKALPQTLAILATLFLSH